VLRRRVWSRNIKNGCSIYIYDISRLRVNTRDLAKVSMLFFPQIFCVCLSNTTDALLLKTSVYMLLKGI